MENRAMGRFILPLLALFLLIPGISALSIRPAEIYPEYSNGISETYTFTIINNVGHDVYIQPYIRQTDPLARYLSTNQTEPIYLAKDDGVNIQFTLNVPDFPEQAGILLGYVGAKETGEGGGGGAGITAVTAILAKIQLFVPYPGKYIEGSLTAIPINVDGKAKLNLRVTNKGRETINALDGQIIIYSNNEQVGLVPFEGVANFDPGQSMDRSLNWDAKGQEAGIYLANATLRYDGSTKYISTDIFVGEKNVEITNFTKNAEAGKINRFVITAQSHWNEIIKDVFAKVSIYNSTATVGEFSTPTQDLQPWQGPTFEGFFDASNVAPGIYNATVKLLYENKTTSKSGTFVVYASHVEPITTPEKPSQLQSMAPIILFAGSFLVMLVLLLIVLLLLLKKRK